MTRLSPDLIAVLKKLHKFKCELKPSEIEQMTGQNGTTRSNLDRLERAGLVEPVYFKLTDKGKAKAEKLR